MANQQTDAGYLQMAFNRCQLRKIYPCLESALQSPAISIALHRVARNLAKPKQPPRHLKGAVND